MEKEKKPMFKRWWFWLIVVIIIIGACNAIGDEDNDTAENQQENSNKTAENGTEENATENNENETTDENATNEEENTAENEEAENTEGRIESGIFEVGKDIEPGLYKSEGSVTYWARLSGFGGSLEEIIANGNPQGSDIVNIDEGDVGFQTSGSGYWFKVDDNYKPEMLTSFSDGTYIVGKDISPGKYKSDGGDSFGYWARLSGFSGELDDIIANGNPEGPTIVEIAEGDIGFQTFGNGKWTKVE
ncbi:hypothetical protein OEV98_02365 [Caldibacillus lycopersici]|uniref:Lipoprotein n=1 Tax=Perspicuibacillus lycopersici TaxID=1325689 RepID=A0AAE3IUP9_9BACI|nr:hypothetical protein [Perspicuibacillus lycopersici]MCU9612405.1 hypothetical protein [Perspicuibacillus lycopersici]